MAVCPVLLSVQFSCDRCEPDRIGADWQRSGGIGFGRCVDIPCTWAALPLLERYNQPGEFEGRFLLKMRSSFADE